MIESHNSSEVIVAKTPLYALHLELGAKMVAFAGYHMPAQYPSGIIEEHKHTRTHAGLFDVSHMGQIRLRGSEAAAALESLVPVDVIDLEANCQRYALFTNDAGGILDDLMISNAGDSLFLVVNAACKQSDEAHLRKHLTASCEIEALPDRALLALQGPEAAMVMERLVPSASELLFMNSGRMQIAGAECFVSRCGYTGEDGFEISVANDQAETLARTLLAEDEVAPIGLGARDSLRLEAGLCLYGHDIDTRTTPVEAGLVWSLSKVRRRDGTRAGGFPGADVIFGQLAGGATRKRVGIRPQGKAPVRHGAVLVDAVGAEIGMVTSGGYGPSIGGPVAMGYVDAGLARPDTQLQAMVRGRQRPVNVVKLPFVKQRYYRG